MGDGRRRGGKEWEGRKGVEDRGMEKRDWREGEGEKRGLEGRNARKEGRGKEDRERNRNGNGDRQQATDNRQ